MSSFRLMLAAFCLISGTQSTQLDSATLVRPQSSLATRHLEGRWAFVAGSINHAPSMEEFRRKDSLTMFLSNYSDSISYNEFGRFGDVCNHISHNISVEGSSFIIQMENCFDITGYVLHTSCPDCLVVQWIQRCRSKFSVEMYLLSRRREVDPKEMEEFRAQLKYFHLPEPHIMDPTKELCAEKALNQSTTFAQSETRVDQSTQSTHLDCEKLVRPLGSVATRHLEGRWAFVAGSISHAPFMAQLRQKDSITVFLSNYSDFVSFNQFDRYRDGCYRISHNISVEGSSFIIKAGNHFGIIGYVLHTSCPDCLVVQWVLKARSRVSVDVYLLSRRREVDPKEMEEFRAQLKCFHMPEPCMMDPTKELCPGKDVS